MSDNIQSFIKELAFEEALTEHLLHHGWNEVIKNPTEEQLVQNWANILYDNNRGIDKLGNFPLTKSEMQQVIDQVNLCDSPYVVNKLIDEVDIHENTNVLEITENSIITDKGEFEGKTLIATGRVPNSEIVADIVDLNEDRSIKVNEFFQTSNPNIYAAGDVTGGITLTPYARKEGISAARSMAGYLNKFDDINVPQSLTLDLDVSFTQKASKSDEDSDNVEDVIIPGLGGPHAFWRILRGETGLTKISLNTETEEIVRASQISPSSIDDTAYLAFLMNMGITKEDFDDFLEVHPSTDAYYKILKIM